MENTGIVNIRGSANVLEVDEEVVLPRTLCKVSSVRSIMGALTADTGKTFKVTATDEVNITVKRLS